VRDSASRETLIGATLQIIETGKYVTTNQYGYFSINVVAGKTSINTSSIGYVPQKISYDVDSNLVVDIFLSSKSTLSNEIIISATKKDANVKMPKWDK